MANCIFLCLVILTTSFAGSSSQQDVDDCPELRCKQDGPIVRFPFFIKGRHNKNCGYSKDFELSCSKENDTVLELPVSVKLHVSDISYRSQYLWVHDPNNCVLQQFIVLDLSASPFLFNEVYDATVFNCSRDSTSSLSTRVDCLRDSSHPFVAITKTLGDLDGMVPCNKMFSLNSVSWEVFDKYFISTFAMLWLRPNCSRCEEKGKHCRLKTNNSESETQCVNHLLAFRVKFWAAVHLVAANQRMAIILCPPSLDLADNFDTNHSKALS
ncbi:hypothetical protein ACFE04_027862 [Oxalis oulophora]